jgi:hypothetical protein
MEHKDGWKRLDEHLLACLARWTKLNSLPIQKEFECVFYSKYRIVLLESFNVSHHDTCVGGIGAGITDLDIELKRSPTLNDDSVGSVWRAQDRVGLSSEYARQGRLVELMRPSAMLAHHDNSFAHVGIG